MVGVDFEVAYSGNVAVGSASVAVVFVVATAEVLLGVTARLFGNPSVPLRVAPNGVAGGCGGIPRHFVNNGNDAASEVLLALDLPLSFELLSGAEGVVVCPSLTGEPLEPIVAVDRLVVGLEGVRLPVDEVCGRSGFVPGERGSVTFRVGVN